MPNLSKQDEQYWNQAKDIFVKSYKRQPNEDKDWAIVQIISNKIKQGKEHYTESFFDQIKAFLMKHINNPILTLLIVKYIASVLGRQHQLPSYKEKIQSLKEEIEQPDLHNFPDKLKKLIMGFIAKKRNTIKKNDEEVTKK